MICEGQTPLHSSFFLSFYSSSCKLRNGGRSANPSQGSNLFDRGAARGGATRDEGSKTKWWGYKHRSCEFYLVKPGAGCYRVWLNQKWQNLCRFWTFICRSSRTIMRGTQCQVRQILFSSYFRRKNALYPHIYVMHCPYPYSHLPTCVQNPPILYFSQRMAVQLFCLCREDELGKKPQIWPLSL